MITSEEQAKGKWCPFARVGVYHGAAITAINRHPEPSVAEDTLCRGAECMAWRWDGWANGDFGVIAPKPLPEYRQGPRLGHCGLASQPDSYGQD